MAESRLLFQYFLRERSRIDDDVFPFYKIKIEQDIKAFNEDLPKYKGVQSMLFYALRRSYMAKHFQAYCPESWLSTGLNAPEQTIPVSRLSEKYPLSKGLIPVLASLDRTTSTNVKVFTEKRNDGICKFTAVIGQKLELVVDATLEWELFNIAAFPFVGDQDVNFSMWDAMQKIYLPKIQNMAHF